MRSSGGNGWLRLAVLTAFLAVPASEVWAADPGKLTVDPPAVQLKGPRSSWTLQVDSAGPVDVSRKAQYRSTAPEIAAVSSNGVVFALKDGSAVIEVSHDGQTVQVPVTVEGTAIPRSLNFENDIIPVLSKYGCNSSGCHGKAEGQNGFKLSVFGFDPPADHHALTQEGRGRRVFPSDPGRSLVLQKAGGQMPHGGGVRIPRNSPDYRLLEEWIGSGLPMGKADDPHVVSIAVTPRERQLAPKAQQQLRVVATFSDGRLVDVTSHTKFQSNNEGLGTVDESGLVTAGETPGDVAIMASYMGAVDVFRTLIPRPQAIAAWPAVPENNFIDGLVYAKLRKLNVVPSEPCSDADFLRRAYLDVIGTLPTTEEARRFLADTKADRRARLVDELLERPEFARFWALKWADVLRVDRQALGHKGAYAYYRWIRDSLAENKPYDQFCRELVAAEGPLKDAPAGAFYKVVAEPGARASTLSQVLLGVRIECAQCHHHPFDRWSQTDYYGMHAFFTQVAFKGKDDSESMLANAGGASVHPRTGQNIVAHALGEAIPKESPAGDRRKLLAAWMTSPGNPWFARNFSNRMWAHFLGRGLVEPVDDFRLTNPPSNPELLNALAKSFVDSKFDVKALVRTITASHVYQLSATPNDTNRQDEQNYSRMRLKRLDAEVLLDAVCEVTGVPEKFPGIPSGSRAIDLWDSQVAHYFLKLFGRPTRVTSCECERTVEPSVAQVLHVMNSLELQTKLSHEGGRIARLVRETADDSRLIEELYLTCYGRPPADSERGLALSYFQKHSSDRRRAAEDLTWSLLNSVEFLFNH